METVAVGDGVQTVIYSKESTAFSNVKLIVIPGNPGVIEFYARFIDALFDKLNQSYSIYGSKVYPS
jgi:hypothetical protein